MAVIAYQLGIFFCIVFTGGNSTVIALLFLWTMTHVFFPPLMILQLCTIAAGYFVSRYFRNIYMICDSDNTVKTRILAALKLILIPLIIYNVGIYLRLINLNRIIQDHQLYDNTILITILKYANLTQYIK